MRRCDASHIPPTASNTTHSSSPATGPTLTAVAVTKGGPMMKTTSSTKPSIANADRNPGSPDNMAAQRARTRAPMSGAAAPATPSGIAMTANG